MRAIYHVTMPPSRMASCDAVIQEIESIRALVPGDIMHLYPAKTPGTRFPRRLWGIWLAPALSKLERRVDLHHVFNPDLYDFALLRFMRRPIIYTAVTGARPDQRQAARVLERRAKSIVVPSDGDLNLLREWGITNAISVQSGIDASRFNRQPMPLGTPPTLLMGSAPWSVPQFASKGVDALLALAREWSELRLIFLFRGVLENEMRQRVAAAGLQNRVEVLTGQMDVNQVLARAHAAVALAADASLIKAFPHSLLESLAAGKPVLVSRSIPMAIDVERDGSGVVIDRISVDDLRIAVRRLFADYPGYVKAAIQAGKHIPTAHGMAEQYVRLYQSVVVPGALR